LTTLLVGINVAVFVLMTVTGVSPISPTTELLLKWGANWGPLSLGTQPWRLLTSNYVHIGIIHLFFNMWCLFNLGALAQRVFDRWTYFLVYTASGIAGSLASLYWHPTVVGAGASGAIFGLAGALIAALYLGKLPFPKEAVRSTMKSLLLFAAYNLFFGLRTGVDNAAHVGGLAGGLALGAFFSRNLTAPVEVRVRCRNYAAIATVILVALGLQAVRHHHVYLTKISNPAEYSGQFEKGIAALKKDDFATAIPAFQKVVQLNPDSPEANYLLGAAYLGANQPDPAIASFQRTLRLKPDFAEADDALGAAYKAKGMDNESQAAYAKAAQLRGK
jgi:membrane associated rhomboid family serine protease